MYVNGTVGRRHTTHHSFQENGEGIYIKGISMIIVLLEKKQQHQNSNMCFGSKPKPQYYGGEKNSRTYR